MASHLYHFFGTCLSYYFNAVGTTGLGWLLNILYLGLVGFLTLRRLHPGEGRKAMIVHWKKEKSAAIQTVVWSTLTIYGGIALWKVGQATYDDHMGLRNRIIASRSERRPNLEGQLGPTVISPAGHARENTIVTVFFGIIDHNQESIARHFVFTVEEPNGRVVRGEIIPPPKTTSILNIGGSQQKMFLPRGDWIISKAAEKPIPVNGEVSGFVQLLFPNIDERAVSVSTLKITFEDANHSPYFIEWSFTGGASELRDFRHLQNK